MLPKLTESGAFVLWTSRQRVRIPLYRRTPNRQALRRMVLCRNESLCSFVR